MKRIGINTINVKTEKKTKYNIVRASIKVLNLGYLKLVKSDHFFVINDLMEKNHFILLEHNQISSMFLATDIFKCHASW